MTETIVSSRRGFLAGAVSLAALTLAGCSSSGRTPSEGRFSDKVVSMYGPLPDEKHPVPAVDLKRMRPTHFRTEVDDPTGEKPGTIVVSTSERYLYLVQSGGLAIRYGIGVGREGFEWSGRGKVGRKAEWPTWTPPAAMIQRQPELKQYASGMPGGLMNPLGARALYIYRNGADTLYRLHGTPEYWTIGSAVSSGCVRLVNHDVIDLYSRVPVGTQIIVA